MTAMNTLQRDRRHAAVRGEQWLRSMIGDEKVDAQNAERVEYYRDLLRKAAAKRALTEDSLTSDDLEFEPLFD